MSTANALNTGDAATWTSQAQGSSKTKAGIVIGVIRKRQYARDVLNKHGREVLGDDKYRAISKFMGQGYSLIERYLVAVERIGASGKPTGTIDLYTPSVTVVDKQMREGK